MPVCGLPAMETGRQRQFRQARSDSQNASGFVNGQLAIGQPSELGRTRIAAGSVLDDHPEAMPYPTPKSLTADDRNMRSQNFCGVPKSPLLPKPDSTFVQRAEGGGTG